VPYPTTHLQLERLLDGTVDAALVWEPWLMTDIAHYDEIEEISPGNFTFGERVIGIGLHINDSFLRNSLDGAIEALSGDGTLEAIVRD
jgi:ABC-type amino acid transport substrate-binding protein